MGSIRSCKLYGVMRNVQVMKKDVKSRDEVIEPSGNLFISPILPP
jgi:hypothetical protein